MEFPFISFNNNGVILRMLKVLQIDILERELVHHTDSGNIKLQFLCHKYINTEVLYFEMGIYSKIHFIHFIVENGQ